MWDWLIILLDDLEKATVTLKIEELVRPSFFVLWLCILFMPLHKIDRNDFVSGLMFILYCLAAAAALMFAIPQHILPDLDAKVVLIAMLLMGLAATSRWFLRSEYFRETDTANQANRNLNTIKDPESLT